jgi:coiled-coil domain-containing protein 55
MSLHGFSGAAGIKYGLNVRGPKKPAGAVPRPTLAAFAAPDDEDDDDDGAGGGDGRAGANAQILRQQQRQRDSQKARAAQRALQHTRRKPYALRPSWAPAALALTPCIHAHNPQAQELYAAALAQDASAFDYDGVYDTMKAAEQARTQHAYARTRFSASPLLCFALCVSALRARSHAPPPLCAQGPSASERARGPSRYIGSLLAKAKEREREADVMFERRTLKERAKEDHLFGDKEKFVTAAYKAKLAADALFLEEEKAKDAAEAADDVTKRRDLSGFYANLLTKNAAYGCVRACAACVLQGLRCGGVCVCAVGMSADAALCVCALLCRGVEAAAAPKAAAAAAAGGAERAGGAAAQQEQQAPRSPQGAARSASPPASRHAAAAAAGAAAPQLPPGPQPASPPGGAGGAGAAAEEAAAEEEAPSVVDAAAAAAAKRARASADAVASARERFLARKRARVDDGEA